MDGGGGGGEVKEIQVFQECSPRYIVSIFVEKCVWIPSSASHLLLHDNRCKYAWRCIHAASPGNHVDSNGNSANYVSCRSRGMNRACHKASKRCDKASARSGMDMNDDWVEV